MKINNVILPIFDFESTPIILYKGTSKIKRKEIDKEVEYVGHAEIKFKFLPEATIEISPYKLALKVDVQRCYDDIFEGLWGVFSDPLLEVGGRRTTCYPTA